MPTQLLNQEQYAEKIAFILQDEIWHKMPLACCELKPIPVSWDADNMSLITSFEMAEWMGNPIRWLHGGIMTTIFDNAMGTLASIHACGSFTPTVSIQVSFLRPLATSGKVYVQSHITKLGKTLIYITAELFKENQENKPAATASAVYSVHDVARFE